MDKHRFKEIWLPLAGDFLRYARSLLNDGQDAEDAVQDLYVRLWKNRDSVLDTVSSPKAYGITVLKNICLDRLRAVRGPEGEDSTQSPDAQQIMIAREQADRLGKAIDSLPPTQMKIIKLRYYEDLSLKEISEKTGLSQINVRVLISRAKDRLRKIYGK